MNPQRLKTENFIVICKTKIEEKSENRSEEPTRNEVELRERSPTLKLRRSKNENGSEERTSRMDAIGSVPYVPPAVAGQVPW